MVPRQGAKEAAETARAMDLGVTRSGRRVMPLPQLPRRRLLEAIREASIFLSYTSEKEIQPVLR
jgi:hypothetical protein